ncbi:MAG TPA: penicillin-binding protein 2 [Patescibacteria group bacterium]|nr:penicillin-binding protein 2 [Patescibacteria group bacterium]
MHKRLKFLQFIFFLGFLLCIVRLGFWQIIEAEKLQAEAQAQYDRSSPLVTLRGLIATADGYPLVLNQQVFTLAIRPDSLTQKPSLVIAALTPLLCKQDASCSGSLNTKLLDDRKRIVLMTGLSKEQKNAIDALGISGLEFEGQSHRFYPEASMSANLLGFVGKNSQGEDQGYFGIEGKYDLELRGKTIQRHQATDALGVPIISEGNSAEVSGSRNVELTIHRDIQYLVEAELQRGMERYGAKEADAVIMETQTGKILAMASLPSYFPGNYAKEDPARFKNPMIADAYEPGSTFKVITVATGIDLGRIGPETPCDDCGAPKKVGTYTIRTWNNEYQAGITMLQALVKSDNTAMMFAADKIGKQSFISYVKNFGFGQESGIDLQDESTPTLRPDQSWGDIDLATASFGQGIAVTGIQMVNAVNAIANGGVLMQPEIADRVYSDGQNFVIPPKPLRRVVSAQTARTVANMMIDSAAHGDAKWTLPAQYSIAGKTGTAQIPVGGHYDENRTIASFVGFAPAENPKFTMLVRLVEPKTSQWGSETAAPLWFSIAKQLFLKMGIQPKQ